MEILNKIIFYVFFSVFCAVVGMNISRFFIPANAGLVAGAMVLWYGIFGLLIGIIASFFICRKAESKTLLIANLIMLVILGVFFVKASRRFAEMRTESERQIEELKKPRPVAASVVRMHKDFPEAGLGIASIKLEKPREIWFYNPPAGDSGQYVKSTDKIVLTEGQHYMEISSAPPWLVPEHLKLDYQIFNFKVLSKNDDYLEVEVNKTDQTTRWIHEDDARYATWPDFLLNCFSVEPIHPQDNLLRIKPMSHASPLAQDHSQHILKPVRVEPEWIQVEILDQDMKKISKAWIRWLQNGHIIIRYNLLS